MENLQTQIRERLDKLLSIRSKLDNVHDVRFSLSIGGAWLFYFLLAILGSLFHLSDNYYVWLIGFAGISTVSAALIIRRQNASDYENVNSLIDELERKLAEIDNSEDLLSSKSSVRLEDPSNDEVLAENDPSTQLGMEPPANKTI